MTSVPCIQLSIDNQTTQINISNQMQITDDGDLNPNKSETQDRFHYQVGGLLCTGNWLRGLDPVNISISSLSTCNLMSDRVYQSSVFIDRKMTELPIDYQLWDFYGGKAREALGRVSESGCSCLLITMML